MNGYMLFTRWPSIQRDSEILRQKVAPELARREVEGKCYEPAAA